MTEAKRSLPPAVAFVLTRYLPCSALALVMLTALGWLPMLFVGLPVLAFLVSIFAITLNMLTPALFALIFIGGGMRYVLQVGAFVTLVVVGLSDFDVLLGIWVGLFYCLLPVFAARHLKRIGGVNRSAVHLVIVMIFATLVSLLMGAQSQGVSIETWVGQWLEPMFASMKMQAGGVSGQGLKEVKHMLVWMLPGFIAFSFWLVWWFDVLLARKIAMRYGFYKGDTADMLQLHVDKWLAYGLMLSLIFANLASGTLQYIAVSIGLVLAGVLAMQGIAVAHVWLKVRGMQVAIVVMYVLLFLWFMMVIPFIILGMLDIWFDYRRNISPSVGGK